MYAIGDRVVHPWHGLGIITDIVKEDILGFQKTVYKIKMEGKNFELKVPVNKIKEEGIRPVMKKEDAIRVFNLFSNKNYFPPEQDILTQNAIFIRDHNYLMKDKKMGPQEIHKLYVTRKIFIDELSYVFDIPKQKAEELLAKYID